MFYIPNITYYFTYKINERLFILNSNKLENGTLELDYVVKRMAYGRGT